MPNFRKNVVYDVGGYRLRASVTPQGRRGRRITELLSQWWPYTTGKEIQVEVSIEADIIPEEPKQLHYVLASNIEDRKRRGLSQGGLDYFPFKILTEIEYIARPDEYIYDLNIFEPTAKGPPETIADFSALSRDRMVFTIAVASIAASIAVIGSVLVNLLL